nr:MAG: D12 class N6 adenine-specific DNA methyltransferase [Bacteriophage sp.]
MNEIKPVLRWPGAKWRIAKWIISYFPKHGTYLEPFFGSGAVFFNKYPSGTETINDIDANIINLFKVCRDKPYELAKAIELTPYSKDEYFYCRKNYACEKDELEKARQYLVAIWQGFGGKTFQETSWAHDRTNSVFRPKYWAELPDRILNIVGRLKVAQIENRNALELIEMYNKKNCLLYIDPPYLKETRSNLHYEHEMAKESEHKQLLELILKHKGPVVISSYSNKLYDERLVLEHGWNKNSIRVQTNAGHSSIECIYLNDRCNKEMSLFEV